MQTPLGLTFVDPATVTRQLSIEEGSKVADFGCGSGFFSFEFAKRIGSDGLVYALDVLPSALEAVASRAKTLGLGNIVTKRVNLERDNGSMLSPGSVDWVVLKDMLFQNERKEVIIREVARVLKQGGQAIVMEWNPKDTMVGPDAKLRIAPETLKQMAEKVGLSINQELNVGGFHYAFVVSKG